MKRAANRIGRKASGLYQRLMLGTNVVRHEGLPEGPKVFAFNHPSTSDPLWMLGVIPEEMSILITEMVFHIPFVGWYFLAAGHIPVQDGNRREAFEEARRRLESGANVGIFPEGALSPLDGRLGRAKTGAVRLALSTGATIVPIGISLERERLRSVETTVEGKTDTARWYLCGPYAVTVGEPMKLEGNVEDHEYVRRKSRDLMARIGELAEEGARRLAAKEGPVVNPVACTATAS